MRKYLTALRSLLVAPERTDRTGVGTLGLFAMQMRFDLSEGFPLLTTKKLHTRSIIHELLWFLRGDTNIQYLKDNKVSIWDEWADENGNLGPVYGKQWRAWPGAVELVQEYAEPDYPAEWEVADTTEGALIQRPIDQITNLINGLKSDPFGRRHIVSAWNPADIPSMKLPPCHCLFQMYVRKATFMDRLQAKYGHEEARKMRLSPDQAIAVNAEMDREGISKLVLDCQLYQRSADFFLGVPFNIASYALLTHMVAQVTWMIPGEFVWTGGDCHLYLNHVTQARTQIYREARKLPTLKLNKEVNSIFDFKFEDISIEGYDPHPAISAPVAV